MTFLDDMISQLNVLRAKDPYKHRESLVATQAAHIGVPTGSVINLCTNNYLGLAGSPELIAATKDALERWGFDMASVRFICGTQTRHLDLKAELARFLRPGAEGFDTVLYSSCSDANGGLFETLFGVEDAIISDELSHTFIIDGVRPSKAARHRYRNRDLGDLRTRLEETRGARHRVIATDGVLSVDGYVAPLDETRASTDEYGTLVMVNDSHAVGSIDEAGTGTPKCFGTIERVDIIISTLGKALGGAPGGYTCTRSPIVELLRQRLRPYLLSGSLAPPIVVATLATPSLLGRSGELLDQLHENTTYFRTHMAEEGSEIPGSDHPIAPMIISDTVSAACTADVILARGIYVRTFSYPVVPKGRVRIRTQLLASLTRDDLDVAVRAFVEAKSEMQ